MEKNNLVKSADLLKQVSETAAAEYLKKSEIMVSKMNDIFLSRTDLNLLIGENNTEMMKDNHANHARFISSILKHHDSEVLVETILWVFRAYRSHGFSSNYWAAQLNSWIMVIKQELSHDCLKEVYPYYEWMQINIPQFAYFSDLELDNKKTMHK